MLQVKVTWHNAGPYTIWGKLAAKLGREPINAETKAEVSRILHQSHCDLADAGRLRYQRGLR